MRPPWSARAVSSLLRAGGPVRARLLSALRRWPAARSGQIAIIFGLMILPILFAAGAAIDYGRRNAAKARLDAAVDAAVLAVISQKTNLVAVESLARMETQFRAEAARVPGVTVTGFTPSAPLPDAGTLRLSATYTATVKTTLAGLMNVPTMAIGGRSTGERRLAQYIDFYLLLDNSPSMGLAATDDDITAMMTATKPAWAPNGCAFACHQHTYDSAGNITGDKADDFYHLAMDKKIKLRIHVLRDAVKAMLDRSKEAMTLTQQFRFETWTFSDIQTRISALTTSADQTKTDADKIDLAYANHDHLDNQTAYERAFRKMNDTVPASGAGVLSTAPVRVLFFVTDGVQDTPLDPGVVHPSSGRSGGTNRYISPIDPKLCKPLKDKGVRVAVLYTTYLPLEKDGTYMSKVKPFHSEIPVALKNCASDGFFFEVSTGGDIKDAMLKMFDTTVASVRITN